MKKIIKIFVCLLMMLGVMIPVEVFATESYLTENTTNNYYEYNALDYGFTSNRSDVLTPSYYIFAGNKSIEEANALLEELNIMNNVKEWAGSVSVINPIDINYNENDLETFESVIKSAPIKNVKIIGIDEGATFVNNYISQRCNYVAGMLLINGEMDENLANGATVPVYLSNSGEVAENYYKEVNSVSDSNDNNNCTVYTNKDKKLQAVAIAKNVETLAEAFSNAWDNIFSSNYRYHNSESEFYNLPILNDQKDVLALEYDLVQTPIFERLNVTYNEMTHQTVSNMPGSDYAWFEYIPNQVFSSDEGSVPLVISIHGNQNDPRLQGDTTGWVELAAKENFIVVSPEYQTVEENAYFTQPGNESVYGTVDGLGSEGIIHLIADLQVKYPQIDSSRIYVTGLSQGGAMTSLLGIQYSDVFAAAASVSGVNVYGEQINKLVENYEGNETAYLYICGDHDWFQMIPVNGTGSKGVSALLGIPMWSEGSATDIYPALQAYQKINGLEVSEKDMDANPYYGMKLENQQWTKLGDKDMLEGQLSNDKGVVMQLAAVKDLAHWNYKPEAEYIWNFFKNYERNVETGELVYLNGKTSNDNKEDISKEENSTTNEENKNSNVQDKEDKEENSNNKTNTETVETGDSTVYLPYFIGLFVSVSALIFLLKKKVQN